MIREFHLGEILTVTTGWVVSTNIQEIYALLNHMTQDKLYTHQLIRASDECKPWLLRQHPQLAEVDTSGINESNWREWLAEQVSRFGESLPVEPIPLDEHERINPFEELKRLHDSSIHE